MHWQFLWKLIKSPCIEIGFYFTLVENRCRFDLYNDKYMFLETGDRNLQHRGDPSRRAFVANTCKPPPFLFDCRNPFRCSSNAFHHGRDNKACLDWQEDRCTRISLGWPCGVSASCRYTPVEKCWHFQDRVTIKHMYCPMHTINLFL